MSKASDVRYGRQGGRLVDPIRPVAAVDVVPAIHRDELGDHLTEEHGFPAELLDAETADTWAIWHDGEHSTRHPDAGEPLHAGHLRHEHSSTP